MRTYAISLCLLTTVTLAGTDATAKEPATDAIPTALQEYVSEPDDSYGYELKESLQHDDCAIHQFELSSQTWQGIPWKHAMYAYVPKGAQNPNTVLLFITGGKTGGQPGKDDMAMGVKLAKLASTPVVFLHQVPNQPLLDGRTEDDLISETFLKYLDTNDAKWPLLFPMVKSAVSAMNAVEDFAQKQYGIEVEKFVVTGASKRGWTTWLTAVADDRVAGIAPIVIDTLNLRPQMKHQLETWGEYSEQIADYTSKGLVEVMNEKPEIPLWRWVDPYTYRSKLTLPKLIINGTNDRYWTVDALNLYWDDLVGEKHVRYVPNAGHGLDGGREGALMTLAVFTHHVAQNRPLPKLKWHHAKDGDQFKLEIGSNPKPESVRLWVARSDTKDFRNSKWEATELTLGSGGNGDSELYVGSVPKPEKGYVALFGEATYKYGPVRYNLSTNLRQE